MCVYSQSKLLCGGPENCTFEACTHRSTETLLYQTTRAGQRARKRALIGSVGVALQGRTPALSPSAVPPDIPNAPDLAAPRKGRRLFPREHAEAGLHACKGIISHGNRHSRQMIKRPSRRLTIHKGAANEGRRHAFLERAAEVPFSQFCRGLHACVQIRFGTSTPRRRPGGMWFHLASFPDSFRPRTVALFAAASAVKAKDARGIEAARLFSPFLQPCAILMKRVA